MSESNDETNAERVSPQGAVELIEDAEPVGGAATLAPTATPDRAAPATPAIPSTPGAR